MNETVQAGPDRPAACWSCGRPLAPAALFCDTCRAVQPPAPLDPFARLGLPASFAVDSAELDRRYFDAQRQLHPDRFALRPPRERALSQAQAVALNEAYEALRDPFARACALLRLNGVSATPDRDQTIADPALLLEQMERREALAEARDAAEATRVAGQANADAARAVAAIGAAFAHGDLGAAQRAAIRLRYLRKLAAEARTTRARLSGRASTP